MAKEKITIRIDGKEVQVAKDAYLLTVLRENGIAVPTLCNHKDLTPEVLDADLMLAQDMLLAAGILTWMIFWMQRQARTLIQVAIAGRAFYRSLGAIVKRSRALSPAAQKLIELLQRQG